MSQPSLSRRWFFSTLSDPFPPFRTSSSMRYEKVRERLTQVDYRPWSSETHVAGTLFCGLNLWSLRNYQLALHAVALDETFIGFAPTVMLKPPAGATLKQVYFAGRHSDLGSYDFYVPKLGQTTRELTPLLRSLGGVTSLSRVSLAWAVVRAGSLAKSTMLLTCKFCSPSSKNTRLSSLSIRDSCSTTLSIQLLHAAKVGAFNP